MTAFEDRYPPASNADLARLVAEHPLAWVVALGSDTPAGTPLPLLARLDGEGRVVGLGGHYSRANSQVEVLRRDPRVLILFMGPQGYVSPSWMADRTQAPTWNYASVQFLAEVTFTEEPAEIDGLIGELVLAQEQGRPAAWTPEEMGPRYRSLSRGVVGFEAAVLAMQARFKLGQDERDDVYPDILEGLAHEGRDDLIAWMRRSNPTR
ncbi:FMN-binding negative transcriptional regulator [Phenylobacterium sp.]|uniref:FMN-binding negative transcriptional regulator n=1 Tax=Phenylobacterium sp. TaxID=1871053 RepID=UPI002FCA3396